MESTEIWEKISYMLLPAAIVCIANSTWPHLNSDVGLEEGEY